jgi:protein-tyrosine phosphatase
MGWSAASKRTRTTLASVLRLLVKSAPTNIAIKMIDLLTHMLPDWDDGADNWDETVGMVKVAERDGITKVGLTPHLFRLTKYGDNIWLFQYRMTEFMRWAERFPLEFFCGAEVHFDDQAIENIKKHDLTINHSNYVFVEFPDNFFLAGVRDWIYKIMLAGFIPIISHPERNMLLTQSPGFLFELVSMGALAQVTAGSILGEYGREAGRMAKTFLENNLVHLIASDAHDSVKRPPLLRKAVERGEKIVGKKKASAMVTEIPQAILDNEVIPNYGDPVNPEKKGLWRIFKK